MKRAIICINRSPEVRDWLVAQGAEVHAVSPAEMNAFFERGRRPWAQVVRQAGVIVD